MVKFFRGGRKQYLGRGSQITNCEGKATQNPDAEIRIETVVSSKGFLLYSKSVCEKQLTYLCRYVLLSTMRVDLNIIEAYHLLD